MDIKSLSLYGESESLSGLFQISGAIRSIIAISAYIDIESINQLIVFVRKNTDLRSRPNLRLFIDKSSSRFLSDRELHKELIKASKKINVICDSNSGIFLVQLGALFHSKAYYIEGNNTAKILFGSMNLTQKGISSNEELLLSETIKIGGRANANRLVDWIKNYADKLDKYSLKVGIGEKGKFPSCIRELLLEGSIYYELKEQDPFRIKLYLPDNIAKQQADIDPLLEANTADSVSLKALITTNRPVGLGFKLPTLDDSKAFWKKYCIETCYGFWNPDCLNDDLKSSLNKKIEVRQPYFDEIKRVLYENEKEVGNCFIELCGRIQDYLERLGIADWKYSEKNIAEKAWNKWLEGIKEKIENEKYYDRLVSGITTVPVPDVWNDPLSSREFEESFCESLIYIWSKQYVKVANNIVAQAVESNLDLDEDIDDYKTLLKKIDDWLKKNPDLNLIAFNE